jgi:hypothetical protein
VSATRRARQSLLFLVFPGRPESPRRPSGSRAGTSPSPRPSLSIYLSIYLCIFLSSLLDFWLTSSGAPSSRPPVRVDGFSSVHLARTSTSPGLSARGTRGDPPRADHRRRLRSRRRCCTRVATPLFSSTPLIALARSLSLSLFPLLSLAPSLPLALLICPLLTLRCARTRAPAPTDANPRRCQTRRQRQRQRRRHYDNRGHDNDKNNDNEDEDDNDARAAAFGRLAPSFSSSRPSRSGSLVVWSLARARLHLLAPAVAPIPPLRHTRPSAAPPLRPFAPSPSRQPPPTAADGITRALSL